MTTEFIQNNFPEFEKWYLSRRAREVVAAWPEVRSVSDEDFYAALKQVSAKLSPNADPHRWEANARLILNQLMRSGRAINGFDMTAQVSAALTDAELLAIPEIGSERIKAINLAIDSLRRE